MQDSTVGRTTEEYWFDSQQGKLTFYLLQSVQTNYGVHPPSYSTDNEGSFLGGTAGGTRRDDHALPSSAYMTYTGINLVVAEAARVNDDDVNSFIWGT